MHHCSKPKINKSIAQNHCSKPKITYRKLIISSLYIDEHEIISNLIYFYLLLSYIKNLPFYLFLILRKDFEILKTLEIILKRI